MEATLSVNRISVVISRSVGNTAKSSGRCMFTATSRTVTASTMLKVNKISSISGDNGNITIASTLSSNIGTPMRP
ncbi:hypothetical protein D3C76_837360 [compost metagenome]